MREPNVWNYLFAAGMIALGLLFTMVMVLHLMTRKQIEIIANAFAAEVIKHKCKGDVPIFGRNHEVLETACAKCYDQKLDAIPLSLLVDETLMKETEQ